MKIGKRRFHQPSRMTRSGEWKLIGYRCLQRTWLGKAPRSLCVTGVLAVYLINYTVRLGRLVPTLPKATRAEQGEIERIYEYGLGSAREARDWYYKGRQILGESVTAHRLDLMAQIIRMLLVMIPDQRGETLKEEAVAYGKIEA